MHAPFSKPGSTTIPSARQATRVKWPMRALAAFALVILGFAAFAAHIGYFGGPIFTELKARAAPPASRAHVAAVVFSGDMGFRVGMGPRIAARLAADGIPVLGVNSLTFFRHERTPGQVTALVTTAVRRALAFNHADRLILIGQSFGADMLHVGLRGLAPELRRRIALVALVVPTDTLFFRASPSELLNWGKPDASALPSARALTWVPVLCLYGRDEQESLCPHLGQPNAMRVTLPGGHALHHDADTVHVVLRAAIDRVLDNRRNITKIS